MDTEPIETFELMPWLDRVEAGLQSEGIDWREWASTPEVFAGEVETEEQRKRRQAI